MSWHTPERKTEQALKLYLQTVLDYEIEGVQIVTRFGNAVMTEPRIEIFCPSCLPWPANIAPYSGNWQVECTIKVVSHYDSGVDAEAHDELVGNLMDVFLITDGTNDAATAEINATQLESDLTVIQVNIGERSCTVEEHSIITEQKLELYIQPSR